MKSKAYVDGVLQDWGAALFNQSPAKPRRRRGIRGMQLSVGFGQNGGEMRRSAGAIRGKLRAIARRSPEVMVKISGAGKGMKQIAAHLDYISRHGQLDLEDQRGDVLKGREGVRAVRDEFACGGAYQIPEQGSRREAFNIVLSMPEGTDPLAVKRAARDFVAREFAEHQYAMALHTFDTDPDPEPSKHPHVHLCVKAVSLDGVRLNPRKTDLQRWREGFAEALREHGIEAAATSRQQRLRQQQRGEKQAVRQMRERGASLDRVGRSPASPERIAKARSSQAQVLRNHRIIAKALASSEDGADRRLAQEVVQSLKARLDERLPDGRGGPPRKRAQGR